MKHQDKSNSLLEKVQHIIKNLCDKGGGSIALLSWLSIVLSVLFDQCRQEYWFPELELIFHRQPEEFSNLGTFIFAIWAVSITFIVFFLGVVNDRRYGIRIIDIVLVGRNAYVNLVCKAIAFLAELIVMLWAVLYCREITITVCLYMQIVWMVYFFWMVCSAMSEKTIHNKVVEEAVCRLEENGQMGRLLYKMIQNIPYEDITEVEHIFDIFGKIGMAERKFKRNKDRIVCDLAGKLTGYMMERVDNRGRALSIIGEWIEILEKNKDKYNEYIKYGIVEGIIDRNYESYCPDIEDVFDLAVTTSENRREMIIWALTYSFFGMDKAEQKYRVFMLTGILKEMVSPPLNEKDAAFLFHIWTSFYEEDDMHSEFVDLNLKRLWKLMGGSENES